MTSCCAIIPARGGSKGIPNKNLRPIGGLPMIAHAIAAARAAERVDRVVVSTDSQEIAAVAERFGAEIVDRPDEISGDAASSESALAHALDVLRDERGYEPDLVCFLQCTSPLTTAEDIDGAIGSLIEGEADSVFAAAPFHYFIWRQGEDGAALAVNHDSAVRLRRQDREPEYRETGSIYVMRADGFRRAGHRFFGKTMLHVLPPDRAFEIDDPEDLIIAEALLQARRPRQFAEACPALRAVVFDFDGVFTDNLVYVDQEGRESVVCSRGDGMGLEQLRLRTDLKFLILSKERNPVVAARAAKVGVPCLHEVEDKLTALRQWAESNALGLDDIVYVGNDINDLACMREVGLAVTPADAHPDARREAGWVLQNGGGRGAIRELADLILCKIDGAAGDQSARA